MTKKIQNSILRLYKLYQENLDLIILVVALGLFTDFIFRATPYLNWFLELRVSFIFLISWALILIIKRPSLNSIIQVTLWLLGLLFLLTLIGASRFSANLGIILFGLFFTIVFYKIVEE